MRENKSGKFNQCNRGSKSNNFETNTKTQDLVLAESGFLQPEEVYAPTLQEVQEAVVYENGVTSLDFAMPETDREILEKNLNIYQDTEKMQKALTVAKKNKALREDLRNLELVDKMGNLSERIFDLMTDERNIEVLQDYIQRKFEEGDIAKAYKEIGLMNKAILDARQGMIDKMRTNKSGSKARIALKFTNDSGEDFQLGAEVDV